MAKKTTRQRVDRSESEKFARVARQFIDTAELAEEVGSWNAAGLLLVHGAILLADAVAIRLKSVKSTSDDHKDAVALLGEVVGSAPGRKEALTHLEQVIDEKNRVAYTGTPLRSEDVAKLKLHVERFRTFAENMLRMA